MKKTDHWSTSIFQASPIIRQLDKTTQYFKNFDTWPDISDYQKIFSALDLEIKPVAQATEINTFEDLYEPRVYLKKELQTRTENWHDFFNAQIWLNFPNTKKTLNNLHYSEATNRPVGSNRSTLENRITQFDECGAIIISNDKRLITLIQEHKWETLFIEHIDDFKENLRCIVFGHAIFEKAISPYLGMTCHCILVEDNTLLNQVKEANFKELDMYLSFRWETELAVNPEKFSAFPILGTPGYWHNQNSEFYMNRNYFR